MISRNIRVLTAFFGFAAMPALAGDTIPTTAIVGDWTLVWTDRYAEPDYMTVAADGTYTVQGSDIACTWSIDPDSTLHLSYDSGYVLYSGHFATDRKSASGTYEVAGRSGTWSMTRGLTTVTKSASQKCDEAFDACRQACQSKANADWLACSGDSACQAKATTYMCDRKCDADYGACPK